MGHVSVQQPQQQRQRRQRCRD